MSTTAWADARAYHADTTAISNSMLKVFSRSPREFYATYIAKTLATKETPAMRLGTMTHMAVFEPDRFAREFIVPPDCNKRTKAGKAEWEEFITCNDPAKFVTPDQLELACAMNQAVRSNDVARGFILADGPCEDAIRWNDEATGLECKALRDKVLPRVIVDLKTTPDVSPQAFARACYTFGYHRQAAYYIDGHKAATGEDMRFAFIAVGKAPPHDVATFELDEAAIQLGREQNAADLARLAAAIELDEWATPWERQVTTLSLPRYAQYENEYRSDE